jgi:hypothetical protein
MPVPHLDPLLALGAAGMAFTVHENWVGFDASQPDEHPPFTRISIKFVPTTAEKLETVLLQFVQSVPLVECLYSKPQL